MNSFILDNRKLLPFGSLVATKGEDSLILCYNHSPNRPRMLAAASNQSEDSIYYVVPDVTRESVNIKDLIPGGFCYNPNIKEALEANKKVNKQKPIDSYDYPREETVALLGGGPVLEEDIKLLEKRNIPIVAVNGAIRVCTPKYWVGVDHGKALMDYFNGIDVSKIHSHMYFGIQPGVANLDWKSFDWFNAAGDDSLDGVVEYYGAEGVINHAIQFVYKKLGPKKIIMLGVQHTMFQYYWIGLVLQALCFWYSKAGVCVWNCTRDSSILAGVFVGPLEIALKYRARSEK